MIGADHFPGGGDASDFICRAGKADEQGAGRNNSDKQGSKTFHDGNSVKIKSG
jgi:hypothetical protein